MFRCTNISLNGSSLYGSFIVNAYTKLSTKWSQKLKLIFYLVISVGKLVIVV